MNIFEQATRLQLRYNTQVGTLFTEDLWLLPLSSDTKLNLDDMARAISKELSENETESFVNTSSIVDATMQLRFDILLHIIKVKLADRKEAKELKDKKRRKEHFLTLLAAKQNEADSQMSMEDIKAELDKL